jgi:hypothetical protein
MESISGASEGTAKNGKDPVMEELHDIKVRLQSIEDYLEEIVERLSEAGVNFGDGFEIN